jgi:C4-dicarboxylate-specific signal transduction histidine kinase
MLEKIYKFRKKAFIISLVYAFAGLLWIAFSDMLVLSFTDNITLLSRYQTEKGFFYVIFTAVLVYFLAVKQLRKIYEISAKLLETEKKHIEDLEKQVDERTLELLQKNEEMEQNLKDIKRMNELFVGREFRIRELKDKIIELESRLKSRSIDN